jgi:hypothetical protein
MKTRSIKIVSDGRAYNTKITIAETGEELPMVSRIDITLDAENRGGLSKALVHIWFPELEIIADAVLDGWPPPEFVLRTFRAWQLFEASGGVKPSAADIQELRNAAEFARHGLRRIN